MSAPTKAIFYRMQSQQGKVLNQFIGSSDSDTQTNANSIAAGTGFTDASLTGQVVAYAYLINPIVYDSATGLIKANLNTTILIQNDLVTPSVDHVHIVAPADETATFVHAAFTLGAAQSTTGVHAAITLTGSPQTVTGSITNPDIPRHVTVTGSQSGIQGAVVITGTDESSNTVSETLLLSGSSTIEGALYFATVTSIAVPVKTNVSSDTVAVGTGTAGTMLGITNPDVARCLSITGSASGVTGNVVAVGLDVLGTPITDTIAASGSSTVNGIMAFKSVSELRFPDTDSSGHTISIGISDKLGLGVTLLRNTVTKTYLGNTLEATAPTVVTDGAIVAKNVLTLNSDLNGSDVDVYLITG